MRNLIKKIILIIGIHIIWLALLFCIVLFNEVANDTLRAISFLLIEPIFLFIIYPIIIYVILYNIIIKEPYCIRNEKRVLIIFSITCTVLTIGWLFRNHVESYIQNGFSILRFDDYWMDVLF